MVDEINGWVLDITRNAYTFNQRTGQYLFNSLPGTVANLVRSTTFDPFYKNMRAHELYEWIDNHLIFDGNRIIGLFNGDNLIWEEDGD